MTTLLTLALDPASQMRFEALRQEHYPAGLNRIPAHLSLFHKLPGTEEVETALREAAAATVPFVLQVAGVRSLGRGVAYTLGSTELLRLHVALSRSFEPHLTPQDRQRFSAHVVVQNKTTPAAARELLASLQAGFEPYTATATGLLWWEYLDGPWRPIEEFPFSAAESLLTRPNGGSSECRDPSLRWMTPRAGLSAAESKPGKIAPSSTCS